MESSLLTAIGGVLGAALGVVGAIFIQHWADWPTALAPLMLAVALLMAVLVGVGVRVRVGVTVGVRVRV